MFDPLLLTKDGMRTSDVPSGGFDASTIIYNGASPTNFAWGDLPAGSNIAGLSLQSIIQTALVGYVEPLFTAFNLTAFNPGSVREMGNSYSLSGSQTFTWTTSTPSNVQPNSLTIRDMTNSVDLGTGLANDGSEALNIGTITFNPVSPGNVSQQWRITGDDTNSNPIPALLRTVTTNFIYPYFYGKVTGGSKPTKDQALINSGTKVVATSTGTITVPFNSTASDWMWFAIPATSTSKTTWYENALNNGPIGGVSNLFDSETLVSIDSPTVLWSGVQYKIYVANYQSAAGTLELRN